MQAGRVLITGASGFVGAHLARDFACAGWDVFALGGSREVPAKIREVVSNTARLDLCCPGAIAPLFRKAAPDIVIHAAALARAGECEENPEKAREVNVGATRNLLQAASAARLPCILVSTDLVFDGAVAPRGGFPESAEPSPLSVYGRTKLDAERIVLESASPTAVLRTSLVYGSPIGLAGGFLAWLQGNLAQSNMVTLFTDEWRTPIYSKDLSQVHQAAATKLIQEKSSLGILHAGGKERSSRYEFGLELASVFGYTSELIQGASQSSFEGSAPRPRDVSLNSVDTFRRLKLRQASLKDGLMRYFLESESKDST